MIESSVKSYKSTQSANTANEILLWLRKEKDLAKENLVVDSVKSMATCSEIEVLQMKIKKQKDIIKELKSKNENKMGHGMILKKMKESLILAQEENEKLITAIEKLNKLSIKKDLEMKEKLEEQREMFTKDLKLKQKIWTQNEQVKREKIIIDRTDKIKKSALKMMEPDIEKLMQQNRIEIFKLKESHREKLNDTITTANKEHSLEIKSLNDEIAKISNKVQKEEEAKFLKRYNSSLEDHEWALQKLKLRLENDYKERSKALELDLSLEYKRKEKVFVNEIEDLKQSHSKELALINSTWNMKLKDSMEEMTIKLTNDNKQTIKDLQVENELKCHQIQEKSKEDLALYKIQEKNNIMKTFDQELQLQVDLKTKHLFELVDQHLVTIQQLKQQNDVLEVKLKSLISQKESLEHNLSLLRSRNESLELKSNQMSNSSTLIHLKNKITHLEEGLESKTTHISHLENQLNILQRRHEKQVDTMENEHKYTLDLLKTEFQAVLSAKLE